MKPRLAVLTLDFAPQVGGVQTYLLEICKRLAVVYDLIVITPAVGPLPGDIPFRRLIIPATHMHTFMLSVQQVKAEQLLIGHAHPRLLMAATLLPPFQYAVLTHGNDFWAGQRRWHSLLFNRLIARARPLMTNSHMNARRLLQLGCKKPIVIHPGTDPARFTPVMHKQSRSLQLLTVGRLVPRKGIDTTLVAVAQLVKQFPSLRYQVGGDGPDRQRLEELTVSLGLTQTVSFLGPIAGHDLPDVYRQADIFVMPTREIESESSVEGFGIAYLEASASGLPVIAGQSGGAVEAVQDGKTGFLVPPDSAEMLTEKLWQLLDDADLRLRLGQNGRHWVETEMNWERAASQMQLALSKL